MVYPYVQMWHDHMGSLSCRKDTVHVLVLPHPLASSQYEVGTEIDTGASNEGNPLRNTWETNSFSSACEKWSPPSVQRGCSTPIHTVCYTPPCCQSLQATTPYSHSIPVLEPALAPARQVRASAAGGQGAPHPRVAALGGGGD